MQAALRMVKIPVAGVVLLFAVLAAGLPAQEMRQGTVAAADPDAGRFVLRLDVGGAMTIETGERLPSAVVAGARVRVFGTPAGGGRFRAVRVEPLTDPTGVRSRLQRGPRPGTP